MNNKRKNTYVKWIVVGMLLVLSLVWFGGCGNAGGNVNDKVTKEVAQEEPIDDQEDAAAGQDGENDGTTTTDGSNNDGTTSSGDGTTGGDTGAGSGTTTPATTTDSTCTIQINCSLLVGQDLTGTGLESLVPSNGVILETTKVTLNPGDTVYDVTLRITKAKGIHMASEGSLAMGNLYIAAISNIYEKDYNSKSGWVYLVNGAKPGVGSGVKELKAGDKLVWAYSLDLGNDL
jgi:hypothetical protein